MASRGGLGLARLIPPCPAAGARARPRPAIDDSLLRPGLRLLRGTRGMPRALITDHGPRARGSPCRRGRQADRLEGNCERAYSLVVEGLNH